MEKVKTKIAINGFGRIGREVFKILLDKYSKKVEVVAINDLTDSLTLAHLLKHDSNYGLYPKEITVSKDFLVVGGKYKIKVLAERDPLNLPWKKLGVDIVLECTGHFRHLEEASRHIKSGAKVVIISAPSKGPGVPSFVMGVNEEKFDYKKDTVCDMGSCTTNCLAPVAKVLNDKLGIVRGFMTTVHSYTNDQRLLDLPHKDLRRARAAALNIVPTTTGAAEAIFKVIPDLKGKLDGMALRVPTPTVSILDLVCRVKKETNVKEVNKIFEEASKTKKLKGILNISREPLVSMDYKGTSFSSTVDLLSTKVIGDMVKVISWYDNEWGYSTRLADFTAYVAKSLPDKF